MRARIATATTTNSGCAPVADLASVDLFEGMDTSRLLDTVEKTRTGCVWGHARDAR